MNQALVPRVKPIVRGDTLCALGAARVARHQTKSFREVSEGRGAILMISNRHHERNFRGNLLHVSKELVANSAATAVEVVRKISDLGDSIGV